MWVDLKYISQDLEVNWVDGGTVYSEDMKRYWDRSQAFLGTLFFLFLKNNFIYYKYIYLFIYFWLCWVFIAVHGLLSVAVCRLLIAVASLCRARALSARASVVVAHGLSSCGLWALEHRLSSCGKRA